MLWQAVVSHGKKELGYLWAVPEIVTRGRSHGQMIRGQGGSTPIFRPSSARVSLPLKSCKFCQTGRWWSWQYGHCRVPSEARESCWQKAGACAAPAETNVLDGPGRAENQTPKPPSGYADGDIFNLYPRVIVPDQ